MGQTGEEKMLAWMTMALAQGACLGSRRLSSKRGGRLVGIGELGIDMVAVEFEVEEFWDYCDA